MDKRSVLMKRHWKSVLDILSPAPQMIIPAFDAFCENIAMIYEKCKGPYTLDIRKKYQVLGHPPLLIGYSNWFTP